MNGHTGIVSRLNALRDEGCAVSVVSLAELYEGVYNSSNPTGNESALNDFLRGVTILGMMMRLAKSLADTVGAFVLQGRQQVTLTYSSALQGFAMD